MKFPERTPLGRKLSERPEGGHEAWFGYTDYATAPMVLRYDKKAGASKGPAT